MAKYTRNYIYIYITQAISILLGLLSLFVVIPYISSNKEVYGIYAICTSLTIFFSYADIGFLSSGQKFASEAYIKGDSIGELKILGFTCMVLLSFLCLISLSVLCFAFNPSLLISGISGHNVVVARNLFLILACSAPVFCFQRIVNLIYSVRLSDYYFQLLHTGGNLLKILSVFYFFGEGKYDIVGYYIFVQVVAALVVIIAYWLAYKKFKVDVLCFIKSIRYDGKIYKLLSKLAYASLFVTVCWVLYYELDNIIISKLIGAEAVAIYAIALSVFTMFRTLYGSLYAPYITRMNYFVGLEDIKGLNIFVKKVICLFYPICIIPILVMSICAKPFIISWVGDGYEDSIIVLVFLLYCNILAFASYPSILYITALQKIKYLYISNVLIVLIFWMGVLLSYQSLGVISFAIMKSIGMIISAIYSFVVLFNLMNDSKVTFVLKMLKSYSLPTLVCIVIPFIIVPYMITDKNSISLLVNIVIIIMTCGIGYAFFYACSSIQRKEFKQLIINLKTKKQNGR